MKINREELIRQLEMTAPGLATREIIEQSTCYILKDKKIQTYNDEVGCSCPTELDFEGAIKGNLLLQFLRKCPDTILVVEKEKDKLKFRGKRKRAEFQFEKKIELPVDSVEQPKKWSPLPKNFISALTQVLPCVSDDESRFVFTCVHLSSEYIESTDTYQLARYKINVPIKKDIILRKEPLKAVTSLLSTHISETKRWVHFKNEAGSILSCRRYTEEFPSLDKLLKIKGEEIEFPKGLKSALEISEIFSADTIERPLVKIHIKDKKFNIIAEGVDSKYREVLNTNFDKEIHFNIPPTILRTLTDEYTKGIVDKSKIKAQQGKLAYVSSLFTSPKKEDE